MFTFRVIVIVWLYEQRASTTRYLDTISSYPLTDSPTKKSFFLLDKSLFFWSVKLVQFRARLLNSWKVGHYFVMLSFLSEVSCWVTLYCFSESETQQRLNWVMIRWFLATLTWQVSCSFGTVNWNWRMITAPILPGTFGFYRLFIGFSFLLEIPTPFYPGSGVATGGWEVGAQTLQSSKGHGTWI